MAEAVVLLILVLRNWSGDRANALVHLPLLIQELFQVVLWQHIGKSGQECDGTNRLFSLAIVVVVCSVPAWFALWSLIALWYPQSNAKSYVKAPRVVGVLLLRIFSVSVCFWLYSITSYWLLSSGMLESIGILASTPSSPRWWPPCTYKGPYGHQIW
jgi:hypothetical protein